MRRKHREEEPEPEEMRAEAEEAVPAEEEASQGAEENDDAARQEERAGETLPAVAATDGKKEGMLVWLIRATVGGEMLEAGWLRRQMGLIVLCVFLAIVYITNRYSAEQEMIEIERLKKELTEVRYRALTRSSELTVKTRQSQVEESLRPTPDSVLQTPKEPPFLIHHRKAEK